MNAAKKTIFALGCAVTVICLVSALACGAIIALRGITPGEDHAGTATFYAVGKRSDNAEELRRSVRSSGGAGVTSDDLVVYAVYTDEDDALSVAEKAGLETETLETSYGGEDGFASAASAAVGETEELWRELEAGETSESYAVSRLTDIAVALSSCEDKLAPILGAMLVCIASDESYGTAGNLRCASATIAVMLCSHSDAVATEDILADIIHA